MKKLLTSTLLLGSLFVKGQIIDTTPIRFINGSATMYYNGGLKSDKAFDTIPCTLIVCDTMHYTNYTPQLSSSNYFDKSGQVIWVNAYKVNKFINGGWQPMDHYVSAHWQHFQYLDADKKPLSKSILVWMEK